MKAKRKLKDLDFSQEGAHIALTHKSQGYSANGKPLALVLKAKSKEFVEKVQQVQVTLELPEFLRRFYGMYYEDAEVLARLLGYVPEEKEEDDEVEYDYESYIEERLQGYSVIKSLKNSDNLLTAIANLDEDALMLVLKAQEKLEPLMESKAVAKATTEDNTSQIGTEVEKEDEVITSVVKQANEENSMTTEVKTVEQEVTVEMVEKAQFELVQKALDEQKAALQKAMETIAQFEAEKKEAVVKAKTAKLAGAVDEKHLAIVTKAALALETDEDFEAFVTAVSEMKQAVEKSALFEEQGASGESEETKKESGVASILKAKYQSK